MEGLESVYAQAVYGTSLDNKIIDHQGSDLIWGGLINSCFMSDLEAIDEIQEHQEQEHQEQEQEQHVVVNRDVSIDPSSLDCSTEDDEGISALFSDSQTLWSFGGVSSAESENREIVNTETTMATKVKSLKRNREEDTTRSHFSLVHNTQDDQQKGDFKLIYEDENQSRSSKKPRTEKERGGSSNISFKNPTSSLSDDSVEPDAEAIAQMKEMIYRAAAFRPVNFGLEVVEKPKRKNVKISTDPQTVAARQRRERISEKIRVLQTLVPGGTKMDTASMLDEAANYLKFLRAQVKALENLRPKFDPNNISFSSAYASSFPVFHPSFVPLQNPNQIHNYQC